ncbi:MAG: electron transfer flavoprotein subunit alpha/FixB family protein [Rhodospirillales bacterium]|nr:MAG: electron transfer flavoprotein subunit alpha/FixB family protein [Rhodospirillales bacterium]
MAPHVLVIAEVEQDRLMPATLECLAEARDMVSGRDGTVQVVLPGFGVTALAETLAEHGADRVTVVEHAALERFSADGWLQALEPVLRDVRPALILAPDSGYGRAWLPRLSARWRMPLVTNCSRAKVIEDGYPEAYRFSHDGRLHERLIWARGVRVGFMMAPDVRGVPAPKRGRQAVIEMVRPMLDPATFRDRTLRTLPPDPRTVDLVDAERIVSGGLGVGSADGMNLLRTLAETLGATLGGTRVAADRGWLPSDRFIGTTGKIVAPKLYIAFGVSGAGQHLAGIGGSQVVIAVNTDGTAPMLKMADLGVVGDLHAIVPILLKKLEALAQGSAAPAALADAVPERELAVAGR